MKKIFTHLFVAVLLMLSSASWAQFQNGKVYRIVCSGTNSVSLGASALTDVAAVSTSETEKAQQWYVTVSGSNYTFRNLSNGRYLLGNNGTSQAWGLTETSNDFTVTAVNGNYAIRGASHANGYGYMHKDGGNNIVSWESGAANSQWTPIEVSYTAAELQAVWDEVEALVVPSSTVSGYQEKLDAIFSDKACTVLKSEYTSANMSDANLENDENYSALPQVLKDMVKKVRGGDWSEKTVDPADRPNGNNNTNHSMWTVADTWNNDYAKKFRVQMYEPYSVEGEITSFLRFNAHCNMDNPTGIYANAGEPMYIMVEGTIEDGAELWVAHQVGHGATNYYNNAAYTQLKEGLNVVPYFANGSQLWINYVVHTYNANEKTINEKFPHKLSEYKPLKIHIEGGKINGFFNAMGDYRSTEVSGDANGGENLWGEVDNDADWNYYKARAALSGDFALLGHRQTLLFDFGTWNSTNGYFGVANEGGGIEKALAWHLENITVPSTPNCYAGSGNALGDYSDTYYPGMQLNASNGKINIMLEAWDRIMYSELATMGLVSTSTMDKMNALYPRWTTDNEPAEIYDYNGESSLDGKTYKEFCQGVDYSEYFNHHGTGVGSPSGYMSGGWRVCNYHYNTMGSIIGVIANEAGPTWGPAHEIGHQHQGVFNLNGQTEVTNNFFSNVAVWYMGMGTSRVNGNDGSLNNLLSLFNNEDVNQYLHMTQGGNIWALTHLYYRLWLYYHLAGNNTQFWPRLFELCRQTPLENGTQISGETSLLRFYQHACDAAGEDLTEFFRAHGYFDVMDNVYVGDYTNATYNMTEEQIDAAIKSVKDKGYPVNYAALLINDATSETTVKHDGATKRSLWDDNATAEYGSVTDFIEGNTSVTTAYEATVSADGTVTMSGGTGGVGFLILNEKGEIVSFSNKAAFQISDEAAYLLATGKATVVAVDADSETAEAEVDLSAIQREMLEALIEKIEAMPIDDGTYTHIGFYTKASAAELLAAVESAKTVLASGTGFAAAYELLYTTKEKFVNSPNLSYVPFDPSLTYIITNYAYKDKTMHLSSGLRSATGVDKTLNTSKWQFKTTGTDGVYNVYNVSGNYLAAASKSTLVSSVSDQASAATYSLIQDSPVGTWAISVSPAAEFATLHDNSHGNVVGWEAGASASKWYLTAVEGSTNSQATQNSDELQALVAKAETLMNEVATVSLKGELQLQADNANSAFFITSNATEEGHEPKYLLDNNVSTFFHTVWWGTSPGADHYLQIDLGEEYPVDQFVFEYTNLPTTSNNVDAAEAITVQVANALDNFTTIATLTTSNSNPLPTAKEGTYTSATMGTKDNNYRYIRLIVTDATGGTLDNHHYFGMSEFSLERLNSYSKVKDAYTGHITQDVVATVADKLVDAKTVIANGGDISAAKDALQEAYDALLLEYNGVANAKKEELQELIDATNDLIAQVGEATVIAGANVDLLGKLYAEREYTAGGTSHSDYSSAENGYNLLDGNVNTHFHSDYNTSTMVSPPYLRVDLGKGNYARKVNFNYTTRNQTGCAPTKINVYGGVAGVEYSQGAIQSSAALNAVTTPTKIVIKNLSGTNSKYFAGASNDTDINAAVLVWEPVEDGVAGSYYLRTTDAVSGYIQNGNTTVELGTKDNAQVFVTTSPSTTGADATYFDGESLVNADLDNLVRFVQEGGSTWLNVQHGDTGTPCLGHTGKGGWTVHNVYLVTETENDTPSYDATPIATFTTGDASNPLPTGTSAKWTSADMESTKDYRFFKFEVAESQGINNGGYYFAISEFGFNIVGEYSVTINPEYQGLVSEELLIETRQEVDAAVTMKKIATSEDLLQAQIDKLQAAYDALEKAKNTPADLDKAALQSLYDNALGLYGEMADAEGNVKAYYESSALTNEKLIEVKAALDVAKEMLDNGISQTEIDAAKTTLQEQYDALLAIKSSDVTGRDELNALIGDMQSLLGEVADKTTAKTAIALQTTDANAEFYIWSNATAWDCGGIGALIDKNDDGTAKTGTFFGTTWDSGTTVNNYDHYITVDLGTEIALNELSIDYTTRNSTHTNQRPTAIKVLGSNDKEGEYVEITHLSEGMPVGQCVKWEMTSTVALDNYYRYIRFAPATEVGYFNMSDFNLYAHSAVKANDNYSTSDITTAQLFAMNAALLDGIAARDNYVTEENYNTALAALRTQYNALLEIKNANVSDRTSLEDLITQTNTLIEEVATVSEEEAAIAMQCTDVNAPYYLYCNAPGKTNNYAGDNLGVAALLDTNDDGTANTGTFLHTTYTGDSYDDDLDHYLRLDMGKDKALVSFKFNYVGRVGNTGNAPKTIVVEGSNDRENFEEITTLSALPTANNATYQSDVITNGKAYRYIRFMVKETSNGSKYKEHQYFALSQFAVTACKTIEVKTEYVSPNLPLSTLVTANNEVVDATVIKNQFYVTETVYDTTEEELQAAKDALAAAIALKNIPVILTTDVNNPVLYKIRINRSALKVLAIDDSDAKVPVEDFVRDDDSQSWYFMQGTDDESYEDIHIFPYWYNGATNTTLRLGAASTGDASAAVVAVEGTDATNTIQNWYITRASGTEEGWWNIQPEGKTNYFSNNGGIANKMGFWNSASDNGSEFQFLLDGPYTDLSIIFGSVVARQPEYNAPGYYKNAADYNAVYDIASGYVTNANGTDEQYTAALDNLIDAETALSDVGRVPSDALEDGAVYRIMNLITNTAAGFEYHYIANSSAAIAFPTTPAVDDNSCLWVCKANSDGTYEFVSALGTLSLGWKEGGENAQAFTIADGVVAGAKCMKNSSSQRMALTNEKYGSLAFNHASNGEVQDANWSTDWYFDKIDDADVKFNVNISSRRFSSLYLPYDVEVPEGVSAFTAVNVDGNNVDLYRVADRYDDTAAGSIIPARTPVILYLEDEPFTAGVYTFTYAPGAEALSDAVAEKVDAAIIFGRILQTPIQCDANTRYYKLGGKSGDTVSKMYWMYKEYGSDGTITNPDTDNGGYIRCSANKIYMTVAESVASNSFSMRFGIDSGTTDINEVDGENGSVETIYDLQGRKLNGITEPGMYIVNGKKVYVK